MLPPCWSPHPCPPCERSSLSAGAEQVSVALQGDIKAALWSPLQALVPCTVHTPCCSPLPELCQLPGTSAHSGHCWGQELGPAAVLPSRSASQAVGRREPAVTAAPLGCFGNTQLCYPQTHTDTSEGENCVC